MGSSLSKLVRLWYAKTCVLGAGAIVSVLLFGCAGVRDENLSAEPNQKPQISPNREYKELMRQAQQVRKEYPELFDHLVRRDAATTELVEAFVRAIPNPEHLPELRIPFMDLVIEMMAPRDDCPVCNQDDAQLWLLSEDLRARLCHLCRTGIYLRGSGVGALGGR